ncbi:MAG: hypothetical protein KAI29_16485 [Cyclobacteriaceae bacterium]|nr:hypothetical protein [Cyclobacteriaceae bacterium]
MRNAGFCIWPSPLKKDQKSLPTGQAGIKFLLIKMPFLKFGTLGKYPVSAAANARKEQSQFIRAFVTFDLNFKSNIAY